jgi:hypothetical protein
MRERRFDLTLIQALWWDDGKRTTLISIEVSFDPDRPDTALLSAEIAMPRISLCIYSNRWPILLVETTPGVWVSPTTVWKR